MPVVRISPQLYKRLESHARGFDTPAEVISRLLDAYEERDTRTEAENKDDGPVERAKPELDFFPDENSFRKHLVSGQDGRVVLFYSDGSREEKAWNSVRFKSTSNLRANIWSGYLRGWFENGIVKAEFHTE